MKNWNCEKCGRPTHRQGRYFRCDECSISRTPESAQRLADARQKRELITLRSELASLKRDFTALPKCPRCKTPVIVRGLWHECTNCRTSWKMERPNHDR